MNQGFQKHHKSSAQIQIGNVAYFYPGAHIELFKPISVLGNWL
jgi:hypothetical protein